MTTFTVIELLLGLANFIVVRVSRGAKLLGKEPLSLASLKARLKVCTISSVDSCQPSRKLFRFRHRLKHRLQIRLLSSINRAIRSLFHSSSIGRIHLKVRAFSERPGVLAAILICNENYALCHKLTRDVTERNCDARSPGDYAEGGKRPTFQATRIEDPMKTNYFRSKYCNSFNISYI